MPRLTRCLAGWLISVGQQTSTSGEVGGAPAHVGGTNVLKSLRGS